MDVWMDGSLPYTVFENTTSKGSSAVKNWDQSGQQGW